MGNFLWFILLIIAIVAAVFLFQISEKAPVPTGLREAVPCESNLNCPQGYRCDGRSGTCKLESANPF